MREQVIDQHAEIAFPTRWPPRRTAQHRQSSIRPCQQALCRRFLIARSAVDLPSKIQAWHGARFERGLQVARVVEVVFNGIARPREHGVFAATNGPHHRFLHIGRQTGGDAVRIYLVRIEPFRLHVNLVAVARGKTRHLVFHRRAIARARAFDDTREHGRTFGGGTDDVVRARVRMRDVAGNLPRMMFATPQKAEHRPRLVTGLQFHGGPVQRAPIQPRRRTGLQATGIHSQPTQTIRQAHGGGVANTPAHGLFQTDMQAAGQESAGGQHYLLRRDGTAVREFHPHATARHEA